MLLYWSLLKLQNPPNLCMKQYFNDPVKFWCSQTLEGPVKVAKEAGRFRQRLEQQLLRRSDLAVHRILANSCLTNLYQSGSFTKLKIRQPTQSVNCSWEAVTLEVQPLAHQPNTACKFLFSEPYWRSVHFFSIKSIWYISELSPKPKDSEFSP